MGKEVGKQGFIYKVLNGVEVAGNKLPDPISIFFMLCACIFVLSAIVSGSGVTAIHPKDGSTIQVINLLSFEQLQIYFGSIVKNFQGFPPLAVVLVAMLGVGVADKTGMMEAALRRTVVNLPKGIITSVVIFVGIMGNAAGDAGFIVLPPLAAMVYMSVGRHPLIGIFAAFGGVAAGFAANLLVSLSDVLAAAFTVPAAQMIDPNYVASPAMNYYFLVASTFVLTTTGTFVVEKIVAPRFDGVDFEKNVAQKVNSTVTDVERKGLRRAGISFIVLFLVLVALCLGDKPFMGDKTGSILGSGAPLMQGVIVLVAFLFFVPGLLYGITTGKVKNDKDVVKMMGASMSEMGSYIVLAFAASQFLALFSYSNLGIMLAIKGAEFLQNAGITGSGLLIAFILLSAFINLFIGSASAKWAIMAPVFVPMFMLIGFDPPLTQVAYRIGDSISNPISPLFPYFPIILGYMNLYKKDAGLGTIISNMLPFTIAFFIVWVILLLIFVGFSIPLGPS